MENDFEILTDTKGHQVQQPSYQIEIIRKGDHGWFLSRKIIFSRTDLLPRRQQIYDEAGNLATDSHYEKYQDYGDQKFPSLIEIWRPAEEYDITLALVKLDLNQPLGDDKFALEQPPGAELVNLDHPQESHAAASTGTAKR
ncbi:MAG: DUF4292 domain-containing protein, partial [Acidobacteriales bacterium]|nr:DUF4292 domain-containing protein [Terriglobales bacterium]